MTDISLEDDFVNSCTRESRKLVNKEQYVEVHFYTEKPGPSRKPRVMDYYARKTIAQKTAEEITHMKALMKEDELKYIKALIAENEELRAKLNESMNKK